MLAFAPRGRAKANQRVPSRRVGPGWNRGQLERQNGPSSCLLRISIRGLDALSDTKDSIPRVDGRGRIIAFILDRVAATSTDWSALCGLRTSFLPPPTYYGAGCCGSLQAGDQQVIPAHTGAEGRQSSRYSRNVSPEGQRSSASSIPVQRIRRRFRSRRRRSGCQRAVRLYR
jgi:hypothetical protein